MVISNRPKDVYYVVALAGRHEPTFRDFYKETDSNRLFLLMQQLEPERQKDYRQAFVKQLQEEAKLAINKEGLRPVKERPTARDEEPVDLGD